MRRKEVFGSSDLAVLHLEYRHVTVRDLSELLCVSERRTRQILKDLFEKGRVFKTIDRPILYGALK